MKKVALLVVVVMFLFGVTAYSGGKYEEVKPFIEKMGTALEKFITGMEKAETGEAVAAALDTFTEVMKKLAPKMKEILKKYPELKDETNHPEELKPQLLKMEELGKKMFEVMAKIQQFANDPKVIEANKRFMEVMQSMQPEQKQEEQEEEQ